MLAIGAATSLAGACPGMAGAAFRPAFSFDGRGCDVPAVELPVALERARPLVPARFGLVSEAGQARLRLAAAGCGAFSVDGSPAGGRAVAEAGLAVRAPDGTPGAHYYLLWQVTDSAVLRARGERAGAFGALVRDLTVEFSQSTPLTARAVARVPWGHSPYSLTADALVPRGGGTALSIWWHDSRQGTLRLQERRAVASSAPATVAVEARPGSPLAALVGAGASAPGTLDRLDLDADAAFEPPAPAPASRLPLLRLTVRPRDIRMRPARYSFLVTAVLRGRRRPVRNAVVFLGGRRKRTDRRGRARFTVLLRRAGTHRAMASARGFRTGLARVRVRPPYYGPILSPRPACAAGRWPVKTLSDARRRWVNFRPRATSVARIARLRPIRIVGRRMPRMRGFETQAWRMKVWVRRLAGPSRHGDIKAFVSDGPSSRREMIIEFPHDRCAHVRRSPRRYEMASARANLLHTCGRRATVIGVGFYDNPHGQGGLRNAVELHPVLGFSAAPCPRGRRRPLGPQG